MGASNDNHPPRPEAARVLLILGHVERDGRVTMAADEPGRADPDPGFPNDPREA